MSDAAFQTAPYSGYTTEQLHEFVRRMEARPDLFKGGEAPIIRIEITRREAVAAGDFSNSTQGERLRAVKAGIDVSSWKG